MTAPELSAAIRAARCGLPVRFGDTGPATTDVPRLREMHTDLGAGAQARLVAVLDERWVVVELDATADHDLGTETAVVRFGGGARAAFFRKSRAFNLRAPSIGIARGVRARSVGACVALPCPSTPTASWLSEIERVTACPRWLRDALLASGHVGRGEAPTAERARICRSALLRGSDTIANASAPTRRANLEGVARSMRDHLDGIPGVDVRAFLVEAAHLSGLARDEANEIVCIGLGIESRRLVAGGA